MNKHRFQNPAGRPTKYNSHKTIVDGIEFDSRKEAKRYKELKMLESAGVIFKLRLQVPFELVPAIYEQTREVYTKGIRKGQPKQGRCIERAVTYIADFVYQEQSGRWVVEDTKGFRTKEYIIKRKLMRYMHSEYDFREV